MMTCFFVSRWSCHVPFVRSPSPRPQVVDLYLCKGRIFKHAGDPVQAHIWFEQARSLDMADRYVCVCMCVRGGLFSASRSCRVFVCFTSFWFWF